MSKVKALRYLLLDTLAKNIEPELNREHSEIANSLTVATHGDNYKIECVVNYNKQCFTVEKNKFIFYERNDFLDAKSSDDHLQKNNAEAFNILKKFIKIKKKRTIFVENYKIYIEFIISLFVFLLINIIEDGLSTKAILITLFALSFGIFNRKLKILTPIILLIFNFFSNNIFLYFITFLYFFIILIDSDPLCKKFRIFATAIALPMIYFNNFIYELFLENFLLLAIIILISFISLFKIFFTISNNSLWIYMFPFFSIILILDGRVVSSFSVIFLSFFLIKATNLINKKILKFSKTTK